MGRDEEKNQFRNGPIKGRRRKKPVWFTSQFIGLSKPHSTATWFLGTRTKCPTGRLSASHPKMLKLGENQLQVLLLASEHRNSSVCDVLLNNPDLLPVPTPHV